MAMATPIEAARKIDGRIDGILSALSALEKVIAETPTGLSNPWIGHLVSRLAKQKATVDRLNEAIHKREIRPARQRPRTARDGRAMARYTYEAISGMSHTQYRITDTNGDNRIATCYEESNAKDVVRLMDAGAAAPELLEACKILLPIVEDVVAADCPHCGGEGSWTNKKPHQMIPVRHKEGCPVLVARAAIAKAEKGGA